MNTEEVAKKVVELTRKQAWHEALDTLYAKDIVSVEAQAMGGDSPEKRGIDAVRGKTDWWVNNMEVHDFKVSGPFVAHDRFVVQYRCRCYRQEFEKADANVGGRRLHGERREDRPRRISAGRLEVKTEERIILLKIA